MKRIGKLYFVLRQHCRHRCAGFAQQLWVTIANTRLTKPEACLACECIEVHILISCNDVDQAMLQNICLVTYMVCCAVVCCSVVASSSAQQCKTVQLSWVIQQDFHLSKLGARDSGLAPASRFATPMARHLASICRELNRCRSLGMRTLLGRSGKPDTSSSSCFGTSSQICTPKLSKQQHHCITDLNTKR